MAEIVRMPKLSDTMTEGVVAEWHKKIGDTVAEGDLIAEIETDKATMEFESFYDGVLLHIGVNKGDAAPINDILAIIGEKGEDVAAIIAEAGNPAAAQEQKEEAPVDKVEPTPTPSPAVAVAPSAPVESKPAASSNGRIFVSPLARKMAEEKGINLATVHGSGENNRIVKSDIENNLLYLKGSIPGSKNSTVLFF